MKKFKMEITMDEDLQLPLGMGYDEFVNELKEGIATEKYKNIKAMDNLVKHLGYIDYREMIAVNKYIIDARRSRDYHQQARAKILQVALKKLDDQQKEDIKERELVLKEEIENRNNAEELGASDPLDLKLRAVFD
jgi:hypothetical protein